jgi:hypothetical protein
MLGGTAKSTLCKTENMHWRIEMIGLNVVCLNVSGCLKCKAALATNKVLLYFKVVIACWRAPHDSNNSLSW